MNMKQGRSAAKLAKPFLLVAIAACLIISTHKKSHADTVTLSPCEGWSAAGPKQPPSVTDDKIKIYGMLCEAASRGYLKPEDFEKLDFTSGDKTHGWNPKYKDSDEARSDTYFLTGPDMDPTLRKHLSELTGDVKPIINLLRYEDQDDGTVDTLYLVLPNPNSEACLNTWVEPVPIAPNNHRIVDDNLRLADLTCVTGTDKKKYLFVAPLFSRYTRKDDSTKH